MKRNNSLSKRRSLNSGTRRKQLLKKLHKKISMRRQDFQIQLEVSELARAS